MLCRQCNDALQAAELLSWEAPRPGADAGVLCQRCGTVMVTEALSARVLDKLAQLTRMGLRGRRVLLRPRPGHEER